MPTSAPVRAGEFFIGGRAVSPFNVGQDDPDQTAFTFSTGSTPTLSLSSVAVPEPMSMALLATGAPALRRRHGRKGAGMAD